MLSAGQVTGTPLQWVATISILWDIETRTFAPTPEDVTSLRANCDRFRACNAAGDAAGRGGADRAASRNQFSAVGSQTRDGTTGKNSCSVPGHSSQSATLKGVFLLGASG